MLDRISSTGRSRLWMWTLVWLAILTASLFIAGTSATARAQPPEEPAAETAPAEAAPAAAPTEQSFISWLLEASGIIGAFIFLLSIYFIATVARLFKELRLEVAMPPNIVSEARALIEKRNFKGVYALVKEDNSHFSQVLRAGLTELPSGLPEAREAMEMVSDVIRTEDEKKISMLAVLGTLGPMIGLLGTLMGMIESFGVIARSDVQLKSSEVAKGISKALVLTFEGVGLSVPAIYFFAVFRNRVSTISANVLLTADELIRSLAAAAKGRSTHQPPTTTAAAPVASPPPAS